jgi:hypothetical protein
MNKLQYLKLVSLLIRIFIGLSAFAGIIVSVIFSQKGFQIEVQAFAWVGLIVALINTALQMILRYSDGKSIHPVLLISSIFAYLYGIASNLIGFLSLRNDGKLILSQPKEHIFTVLFVGLFSMLLEVVPEFMIIWALFTGGIPDIILKIAGMSSSTTRPQGTRKPSKQQKQTTPRQVHRDTEKRPISFPAVSRK